MSHSTRDEGLVNALTNLLEKFGMEVYLAERDLAPGERLDEKVFRKIDDSDCVVVLLTRNGIVSSWVHQEIGRALDPKNLKPLIPLVEMGVDKKNLAALQGKEYIQYDQFDPREAMVKTSTFVKSLKLKKEEREKTLWVAGCVIAFFLLLFMAGRK